MKVKSNTSLLWIGNLKYYAEILKNPPGAGAHHLGNENLKNINI
jgi:hypothetical protein